MTTLQPGSVFSHGSSHFGKLDGMGNGNKVKDLLPFTGFTFVIYDIGYTLYNMNRRYPSKQPLQFVCSLLAAPTCSSLVFTMMARARTFVTVYEYLLRESRECEPNLFSSR